MKRVHEEYGIHELYGFGTTGVFLLLAFFCLGGGAGAKAQGKQETYHGLICWTDDDPAASAFHSL